MAWTSDPASAVSCASDELPRTSAGRPTAFHRWTSLRWTPTLPPIWLPLRFVFRSSSATRKHVYSIVYITCIPPVLHFTCTIYPAVLIVGTCLYVYDTRVVAAGLVPSLLSIWLLGFLSHRLSRPLTPISEFETARANRS